MTVWTVVVSHWVVSHWASNLNDPSVVGTSVKVFSTKQKAKDWVKNHARGVWNTVEDDPREVTVDE